MRAIFDERAVAAKNHTKTEVIRGNRAYPKITFTFNQIILTRK